MENTITDIAVRSLRYFSRIQVRYVPLDGLALLLVRRSEGCVLGRGQGTKNKLGRVSRHGSAGNTMLLARTGRSSE